MMGLRNAITLYNCRALWSFTANQQHKLLTSSENPPLKPPHTRTDVACCQDDSLKFSREVTGSTTQTCEEGLSQTARLLYLNVVTSNLNDGKQELLKGRCWWCLGRCTAAATGPKGAPSQVGKVPHLQSAKAHEKDPQEISM